MDKYIRELEYLAYHDDMTKLYNRHYLFKKLIITDYIFLYFIDINKLKIINDSGGHFSGDEHIRKIIKIIKSIISINDIMIRYGGDEFLVFSNTDDLLKSNELYSVGKTKTTKRIRRTIKKANTKLYKNKQ